MKLCLLAFLSCVASEERENETFVVYPGGEEHTFSKTLVSVTRENARAPSGPFTCSFTYIAQGGTNEEWEATVGVNEDHTGYSCTILRPSGTTYLYIENWTMELKGATVEHYSSFGNENRRLLSNESRQSGQTKIMSTDSFSHELAKISVIGRAKRSEL